jgi:hypothetical protein
MHVIIQLVITKVLFVLNNEKKIRKKRAKKVFDASSSSSVAYNSVNESIDSGDNFDNLQMLLPESIQNLMIHNPAAPSPFSPLTPNTPFTPGLLKQKRSEMECNSVDEGVHSSAANGIHHSTIQHYKRPSYHVTNASGTQTLRATITPRPPPLHSTSATPRGHEVNSNTSSNTTSTKCYSTTGEEISTETSSNASDNTYNTTYTNNTHITNNTNDTYDNNYHTNNNNNNNENKKQVLLSTSENGVLEWDDKYSQINNIQPLSLTTTSNNNNNAENDPFFTVLPNLFGTPSTEGSHTNHSNNSNNSTTTNS